MLKLSTKEIQDKFSDIIMRRVENKMGKPVFVNKMLASMNVIRGALQKGIDREKNASKMIKNVYSRTDVKYINVFDTVYAKGGILVDFLIYGKKSMNIFDFDFGVSVVDKSTVDMSESICVEIGAIINKELAWLNDAINNEDMCEVVDELYSGFDFIEVYGAYNLSTLKFFPKETVLVKRIKNYIGHYHVPMNAKSDLYRFHYTTEITARRGVVQELKICVVDFTVEVKKDPFMSKLLNQVWIDKDLFIIGATPLGLLNDQLHTILFDAIVNSGKYEKRKRRIYGLLTLISNEDILNSYVDFTCEKNDSEFGNSELSPYKVLGVVERLRKGGKVDLRDFIVQNGEYKLKYGRFSNVKEHVKNRIEKLYREVVLRVINRKVIIK